MTEQRRHTVAEVDALRCACRNKYLWGTYKGGRTWTSGRPPQEEVAMVEEMVRTHMLARHTAEDLLASEKWA
jgi:hypothetical protein